MEKRLVGLEISIIKNLIHRSMSAQKDTDISSIQCLILAYIVDHEEDVFQKDIEKAFTLRRSTATEILKNMEKNGLIKRVQDTNDGRLKKIVLTDKAINVNRSHLANRNALEEKMCLGIGDKDLEIFFDVIDKIKMNIER